MLGKLKRNSNNQIESFFTNQNLNLKNFNLITLSIDKQDFRVDLNTQLDTMFCRSSSPL